MYRVVQASPLQQHQQHGLQDCQVLLVLLVLRVQACVLSKCCSSWLALLAVANSTVIFVEAVLAGCWSWMRQSWIPAYANEHRMFIYMYTCLRRQPDYIMLAVPQ